MLILSVHYMIIIFFKWPTFLWRILYEMGVFASITPSRTLRFHGPVDISWIVCSVPQFSAHHFPRPMDRSEGR